MERTAVSHSLHNQAKMSLLCLIGLGSNHAFLVCFGSTTNNPVHGTALGNSTDLWGDFAIQRMPALPDCLASTKSECNHQIIFSCQFPRISLLLPHSLPICRAIDVFVDLLRIRRLRHPVTIPVPFSVLTQTIITTRSKNHLLSSAAAIDQASQPKNQRQIRARERHTCSQIVCTSRLPTVFVNRRTDSTGTSKLVPHQSAIAQSCQSWLCSPESS